MTDSESDIEIKSALPKGQRKKATPSPSEDIKNNNKKITTKTMIIDALVELKTRKGVSLYAIKKFLTEKYNVNTEKINFVIKKTIKSGVEDGTIIQMKGIGASGSFKLAPNKISKPKKKKPEKVDAEKKTDAKDTKDTKKVKTQKKEGKGVIKPPKKMDINKKDKTEKTAKKKVEKTAKKKVEKDDKPTKNEENEVKKKKVKIAKVMQTPSKKRAAMMKRKSIGTIIKPPKMKPKSKA